MEDHTAKGTDFPVISCQNISKNYHRGTEVIHALNKVNLNINQGEFVSIVGPSGSGKSTLAGLIGCLDTPSEGRVLINNQNSKELSSEALAKVRNQNIGFVFQQFHLLGRSTALKNVEMPLIYAGLSAAERKEKAAYWLDRVGLSSRLHHSPAELSGGEQQRVAIARAVVNAPNILLADEPTGALDTKTGEEILKIFETLNQEKITILLITHEKNVARYSSRQLEFLDGNLISDKRVA